MMAPGHTSVCDDEEPPKDVSGMPEDRGFETLCGELILSIYLILQAALGPGVHSASNSNEYQKQKNISGEKSAVGA
jgi:hypothetical protein